MVFHTPSGNLDNNKGFRKPKPLNMNTRSQAVTRKKKKYKNWKGKKNNSVMARSNFNNNMMGMVNSNNHAIAMMNPNQNALARVNAHNNALPMPMSRFGVPSLLPPRPYALQGTPAEAFYMMNASIDSRLKGRSNPMHSRNGHNKRRIPSKRKVSSPYVHVPLAPYNTTSFIMRAKKLGGIAPAVTPSPATPAVLSTPLLSPGVRDKGSLEDMNKELGVDGYGSMNGLIRLRSYQDMARDGGSESESELEQGDVANEEHSVHSVERLEQRIDQGLSRFEMIYPSRVLEVGGGVPRNVQGCVISQERMIAHLEEENLTLKERLFLVEQELNELRHRVRQLDCEYGADDQKDEQCEESCGDVGCPVNEFHQSV